MNFLRRVSCGKSIDYPFIKSLHGDQGPFGEATEVDKEFRPPKGGKMLDVDS